MSSAHGDDFQDFLAAPDQDQPEGDLSPAADPDQPEVETEAGPRAERPNFLTATRFVDFDLPPEIMEGLDKAGFEYCTPIQAQAIPVAMSGLDIAGQAQTGTGKTTAFLVPLLNRLLTGKPLETGVPRALIVTPTRELALQIHEDALVLAEATNLRQVLVIGGMDYKEQAELLATAPEIVICTPGRIIDYLQQGVFKTKGIEVAVVDEADRLLDMGFIKDLKYLLGKLPPFTQRQTMLFSATLDERVLELTYEFMNPPQYITAEPDKSTKVNIAQELYHVGRDEKLTLLMGLLRREEHRRVIIFANTKSGVEWLSKKLTMNGFQAEGITGDLPQPKRLKLMEAFKENRLQILVATDVASRGIHVDDVSHVYNYDLPQDAENYVHRIGRTARAGHEGKAVSFGCEDYVFHLEAIENLLGEKIPVFWAEQDWFQEDLGGEVHLKDRRGGDRKKSGSRGGGREGRSEGGSGRSGGGGGGAYRGPAKSQRPGGIFGLSPRLQGQVGEADPRHTLTWNLEGEPETRAELEMPEAASVLETQDKEKPERGDRRRKRRRGRRGRDAVEAAAPVAAENLGGIGDEKSSEAQMTEPVPSRPEAPKAVKPAPIVDKTIAETVGQAKTEAKAQSDQAKSDAEAVTPAKAAAKKPRRTATTKPKKVSSSKETKPAAEKESIVVESPAVTAVATEAPGAEAGAKKTAQRTTRGAQAKKAPVASDEVEAKKPRRAPKKVAEEVGTIEAPGEKPVKKTAAAARATKKSTETPKAAQKATTPKAAAAPESSKSAAKEKAEAPAKKITRTTRKKADPAEVTATAEEAPKKRGRAPKKTDESPTPAKKSTAKKAVDSAEAPVKKSRTVKKSSPET